MFEVWAGLPVEPPAAAVGRGAGAALRRLVVVAVHRAELVPVVGGQTVASVAGVSAHPQPVVILLTVHPAHNASVRLGRQSTISQPARLKNPFLWPKLGDKDLHSIFVLCFHLTGRFRQVSHLNVEYSAKAVRPS